MASFQNPPSQRLSELQDQRAKLIVLIDAFNQAFLHNYKEVARYPWLEANSSRASMAAQVTAHEATVARIDREIAALKTEMNTPEVRDDAPTPQPEVQPFIAHA